MADRNPDLGRFFLGFDLKEQKPNIATKLPQGNPAETVKKWVGIIQPCVNAALVAAYPSLKESSGLFIDKVHVAPLVEIQRAEQKARPVGQLSLYQRFKGMGASEEILKDNYYGVGVNYPYYANYETAEIWFTDSLGADFSSGDYSRVLNATVLIGESLIRGNLKSLATRIRPDRFSLEDSFAWRDMMATDFEEFVDDLRETLKTDEDRLVFAQNRALLARFFTNSGMNQERSSFLAVGAEILYLFPGQTQMTAEARIGEDLDTATLTILSEPVKKVFREIMTEKLSLRFPPRKLQPPSSDVVRANAIYRFLGIKDEELLNAYIHSEIPRRYFESDAPEFDPFQYGKLVDPRKWLQFPD